MLPWLIGLPGRLVWPPCRRRTEPLGCAATAAGGGWLSALLRLAAGDALEEVERAPEAHEEFVAARSWPAPASGAVGSRGWRSCGARRRRGGSASAHAPAWWPPRDGEDVGQRRRRQRAGDRGGRLDRLGGVGVAIGAGQGDRAQARLLGFSQITGRPRPARRTVPLARRRLRTGSAISTRSPAGRRSAAPRRRS